MKDPVKKLGFLIILTLIFSACSSNNDADTKDTSIWSIQVHTPAEGELTENSVDLDGIVSTGEDAAEEPVQEDPADDQVAEHEVDRDDILDVWREFSRKLLEERIFGNITYTPPWGNAWTGREEAQGSKFKLVTRSFIDPVRIGQPHLIAGNFHCLKEESCLSTDLLVTARSWESSDRPMSFQPNAFYSGEESGLRLQLHNLYPQGLDLEDPYSFYELGFSVNGCKGDVNNDGYEDIVVVNNRGPHQLYLNRADAPGTFTDATDQLHEMNSFSETLLGQLKKEVEEGTTSLNSVGDIFKYNAGAVSCAIADFNGDKALDIVVSHTTVISGHMLRGAEKQDPSGVKILQIFLNNYQNKRGQFRDVSRISQYLPHHQFQFGGLSQIKAADLDADGDMDLAIACATRSNEVNTCYNRILLNNGHAVFDRYFLLENDPHPQHTVSLEIATTQSTPLIIFVKKDGSHSIYRYRNINGNKSFHLVTDQTMKYQNQSTQFVTAYNKAGEATDSTLCDINNDRQDDLIVSGNSGMQVYVRENNNGAPSFKRVDIFNPDTDNALSEEIQSIACVDIKKDGKMDLVAGVTGSVIPVLQAPNGRLGLAFEIPIYKNFDAGSHVGDVNNDGYMDISLSPFRNFHQDASVRRLQLNQLYVFNPEAERFDDWSPRLQPDPKLDNRAACLERCGNDENCIAFCDVPDTCEARCNLSCGGFGDNLRCRRSCSANEVRKRLYGNAICDRSDCAHLVDGGGAELAQCRQSCWPALDLSTPEDQSLFNEIYDSRNKAGGAGKEFGAMVIEESDDIIFIDYNRDGYNDLVNVNRYQVPILYKNKKDGQFEVVGQENLPCIGGSLLKKKTQKFDINKDGIDDVLISSENTFHVWLGTGKESPAFVSGPVYENWSLRHNNIDILKIYERIPFQVHPQKSELTFLVKAMERRNEVKLFLYTYNDENKTFFPQEIQTARGESIYPRCFNHLTQAYSKCQGQPIGHSGALIGGDLNGDGKDDIILTYDSSHFDGSIGPEQPYSYASLLLVNESTVDRLAFSHQPHHLNYNLYFGDRSIFKNRFGTQRVFDVDIVDFNQDGYNDMMVTDFNAPVMLINKGAECWNQVQHPCFEDQSLEYFGTAGGWDGQFGLKNYSSDIANFNGDGKADIYFHSAGVKQLFLSQ